MALKHLFKITSFVLFMVSVINANVSVASGQSDNNDQASSVYKLVWADEINKDGSPDPCNWTNEELQWYQPDNAQCKNSLLIIEGRRERKPNPTLDR